MTNFNFSNLIELLFKCWLILCQISPSLAQTDGRIVGGEPTTIDAAPYLVQLRSNDFIFCAGTLVSEYYVITAAHCFDKARENVTVVGGASKTYNDPGTARSDVSLCAISKKYNSETFYMDIAVVKLKQALAGGPIKPIPIGCDSFGEGAEVKLFGWGKKHQDDQSIPLQLQMVKVQTIPHGWCKWLYYKKRTITDRMFCASAKGKDACSGDSGGPAIVNNQLCGVISWGVGCAAINSPGVYTNVRAVSKFVNNAVKHLSRK